MKSFLFVKCLSSENALYFLFIWNFHFACISVFSLKTTLQQWKVRESERILLVVRESAAVIWTPVISRSSLGYLQMLIEDFVTQFMHLFPGRMTPNLHYLLHYPQLIATFGPPRALWCMRFEAKHQHFKRLASICNNYKNICLSLAVRHQLHQCWQFSSVDILSQDAESRGKMVVPFTSLPYCFREKILHMVSGTVDSVTHVQKVTSLAMDSVKYKVGDVFVLALLHAESIPLFFKVTLTVKTDRWLLCGYLLVCNKFCTHLHAYQVTEGEWWVSAVGEMLDHHPLDEYTAESGEKYVVMRYQVMRN